MTYRKKLIEVALPLDAINRAAAEEKSVPRRGHPSTLHLWWSRKPLAACRAVLFASLVDDPSSRPEEFPTEEDQQRERERLFKLMEKLVKWENINDAQILRDARKEILKSTDENPPPVLDPFCGGGSIPLEAQRLGLEAHASDLNPVAVLITKAMIEIPPRFSGQPPVNPESRYGLMGNQSWKGATGLAEDVHYYGTWLRNEAEKQIGEFYPKVLLPKKYGNKKSPVLAWFWARTVKCPNPACGAKMPLATSFWISKKRKEGTWIEPFVDRAKKSVRFEVKTGAGGPPEGTVDRRGARCIVCDALAPLRYVRAEGQAGRMDRDLMAIVAKWNQERIYLNPSAEHVSIANKVIPTRVPVADLPHNPRDFKTANYGMTTFESLFTQRQLAVLETFSDLVGGVREKVKQNAIIAGVPDDDVPLSEGGKTRSRTPKLWQPTSVVL